MITRAYSDRALDQSVSCGGATVIGVTVDEKVPPKLVESTSTVSRRRRHNTIAATTTHRSNSNAPPPAARPIVRISIPSGEDISIIVEVTDVFVIVVEVEAGKSLASVVPIVSEVVVEVEVDVDVMEVFVRRSVVVVDVEVVVGSVSANEFSGSVVGMPHSVWIQRHCC